MINIHKELWVIKGFERDVEDSKQLLAYMTHVELNKSGEPTQAFEKRKETGTSWAKPRKKYNHQERCYDPVPDGYRPSKLQLTFPNEPVSGFKIIGSVSRWSTSNKLIQVEDPRGFVVEIPTGNLTTLLKHTTVTLSEVMEPCVWGKEGNNHILLPINSDVYKKATEQTAQNNNKVNLTKLEVGQVVKFNVDDDDEYIYLGRGKAVWDLHTKVASLQSHRFHNTRRVANINDPIVNSVEVKDTKLCFIFKNKNQFPEEDYKSYRNWEYKQTGKAVVVGKVEDVPEVEEFEIDFPDRLKDDYYTGSYYPNYDTGFYNTHEVKYIEMK